MNPQIMAEREKTGLKLADFLMEQVDALRWHDNHKALDYAAAILNLGCGLKSKRIEALGFMAIGDTLAIEGCQLRTAWSLQQKSADLFKAEHDKLGWARTTIGRTGICIEVNLCSRTLYEARQALNYFLRNNCDEYYLRLCKNITKVYNHLGKYHNTIELYNQAQARAGKTAGLWNKHMGILSNNTGLALIYLGMYQEARKYFELALDNFIRLEKQTAALYVRENIAFIEQLLGNYREALTQYHGIIAAGQDTDSMYIYRIKLDLIDCYLVLNQDLKARKLADQLLNLYSGKDLNNLYDLAHTLRCLGYAEAKLCQWEKAENQFMHAERIFKSLQATTWCNLIRLTRAGVLMKKHNYNEALQLVLQVKNFFKAGDFFINYQEALLIQARCLYKLGNNKKSLKYCRDVLRHIENTGIPQLHYAANLLAGEIREAAGSEDAASENYYAAFRCLEEWQKNLTLTIKAGFMEDKCRSFFRLMYLALKKQDPGELVSLLERFRWCTLLGYMSNRSQLYWSAADNITKNMLENLKQLREKHALFFRMRYERHLVAGDSILITADDAKAGLESCEEQIRLLVEQLYLRAEYTSYLPVFEIPTLDCIRQALPSRAALLAYYYGREKIHVILIDKSTVRIIALDAAVSAVQDLLSRYFFNIQCQTIDKAHNKSGLMHLFQQLGYELYSALIRPCAALLDAAELLYFVPYGLLSYVPFNTLYDGTQYLVDKYTIAVLPSIAFLFRKVPARAPGGTVIACSKNGMYPCTLEEAGSIAELCGCSLHREGQATRDKLVSGQGQILHIAAHGMHRPDQPEFSFIELADGQLFADDLIQMNLNYELVVLSGCETGRLAVKQGAEPVGLARGALLAGAGSLVVSLWHIDDQVTASLMTEFYTLLKQGHPRAYALAAAQRAIKARAGQLSPAQWGAFQLIGDSAPLGRI